MLLLLQKVWKSLESDLEEVVGQLLADELVPLADLLTHLQQILVRNISIKTYYNHCNAMFHANFIRKATKKKAILVVYY